MIFLLGTFLLLASWMHLALAACSQLRQLGPALPAGHRLFPGVSWEVEDCPQGALMGDVTLILVSRRADPVLFRLAWVGATAEPPFYAGELPAGATIRVALPSKAEHLAIASFARHPQPPGPWVRSWLRPQLGLTPPCGGRPPGLTVLLSEWIDLSTD